MMKKEDIPNTINWVAGGNNYKKNKKESIVIEGWNMMKAAGVDNIALINAHLITTHPDILILNEPSSLKNKSINYDYNCFGEDKYSKIIAHKSLKIKPKIPKWNDELNKLYEFVSDKGTFLIYGVYNRPDGNKKIRMEILLNKLYNLINMYKSPQIIMFGDLNIRKEELLMKYGERIKKIRWRNTY